MTNLVELKWFRLNQILWSSQFSTKKAAALAATGDTVRVLHFDAQQQATGFQVPDVEIIGTLTKAALKKAIESSTATWTIIDCPPSLDEAAPALPLADLVIAPVPPRFQDISGFAALRRTVDAARERGNQHWLDKNLTFHA